MRSRCRVGIGVVLGLLAACDAFAQASVRVTEDQTLIWNASFTTVAATVAAGTELEVTGQRGGWFEVVLPFRTASGPTTGFIAASRVEATAESLPQTGQPGRPAASVRPRHSGARVFADAGYVRFRADQSFRAILDKPGGVTYGGGFEFHDASGAFLQVAVEQFRETGERVFISGGRVFRLGIPETITVTPVTVTAGYRVGRRSLVPYLGGGVGRYFFTDESDLSEPSENVKEHFTGYHVLGGIESHRNWFGVAFEVEYSWVPDALSGGAAAAFDERTLNGVRTRVKLLFGK